MPIIELIAQLHQKLAMINCCILRRRQNLPAYEGPDSLQKEAAVLDRISEAADADNRTSKFDKFNAFLENFVDPVSDGNLSVDEVWRHQLGYI